MTAVTAVAVPAADALAPVRAALLARAHADAEAEVARADAEAAATLREAERQAGTIRQEARARGEADAHAVLGTERARARREARGVVLAAQSAVLDGLRTQVHERLSRLRDDPAHAELEQQLAAQARALLGPDARLAPHPSGGFVAESDGRRAELTLAAVADRVLDRLGPELPGLWSR